MHYVYFDLDKAKSIYYLLTFMKANSLAAAIRER